MKLFLKELPALAVMALSTFIVCLSATLTQTISYDIRVDLDALAGTSYQWMFPAFIAGECATMAIGGMVIDRLGRKWPYVAGSALFIIGTAMDAVASDMDFFLLGRVIQGAGAGLVIVTCVAQVYYTMENRKLRYISNGVLSLGFGVGMLFGIFFGRIMDDAIGWINYHWLLLVCQAVLSIPCYMVLKNGNPGTMKMDILGGTILAVSVAYFVYFLEKIYLDWSVHSTEFRASVALLLVLAMLFVIVEMKSPHSLAHRALDNRKMMVGCLVLITVLGLVDMATVGWMVKTAFFTYGMSVSEACPWFLFIILGSATTAIVISEIIDKTGHLIWVVLTAIISPLALYSTQYIDFGDPSWQLALHLYGIGLGIGCLITLTLATIQNRTDENSNGGYMSYALMLRTAALWLGFNIYQAGTDGYMKDELGDTMATIYTYTGITLPSDSTVANSLLTPMRDSIEMVENALNIPLVEKIGTAFVGGVSETFTIMGILFSIVVLLTAFFFVGRKKTL